MGKGKKYKIIEEDLINNIISFLDEIQFDAVSQNDKDSMHVVNFCTWAISELLNSQNAFFTASKPKKKSRDEYVDETFMDWNLPEMTDEEYEKLVDQFDAFLRGWEKEYYKKNPKQKPEEDRKDKEGKEWKPRFGDVVEHCSLEEIKDMLIDDPELTDDERFELYYEEYQRVNKKKEKTYTFDQLFKGSGIENPRKKRGNN